MISEWRVSSMIKMNEKKEVVVEYMNIEYCFKNQEEYKNFVILLTDPINKFDESCLNVDEDLDEREYAICEKYQDFLKQYLSLKDSIIKEAKEDVEKKVSEE